ncbi:RIP metalloprotease RseP [Bombilactobacillus thymidiniphilus]|uniref:Zinc metalloprotease n=1 Tax=Bombilactobacillus thymidiniphilus TaxID=2923363 RepID=A0ABY4PCL0_9LACO|nr:RIP metalloprotease RseP [Bombilactobacillus thymidiniphilus]UQS83494.1 RIP metalloprotease RseP [Bombilactobacillus thymidiniphilus]
MLAIITFIIVFGLIVLVHEFGHYFVAKRSGILVRQFSIGMGPKLVSYTRNHTLYVIRLLPLGGYVMMAGAEDDDDELKPGTVVGLKINDQNEVVEIDNSQNTNNDLVPLQVIQSDLQKDLFIEGYEAGDDQTVKRFAVNHDAIIIDETGAPMQIAPIDVQFNSASLKNRLVTNLAGPFNNIVFGILVYIFSAFLLGGAPVSTSQLGTIQANSPAEHAHLQSGDQIVQVGHHKIDNWDQLVTEIQKRPNQKTNLVVKNTKGQSRSVVITPKSVAENKQKIGQIGITQARNHDFGATLQYGFQSAFAAVATIVNALKNMVTGGFNINQLGGPVAIYSETSQVAAMGWKQVVLFVAWLSINLGIMNMLPIPALDGGKVLLNIIEGIRRKPVSQKTEIVVNLIGVGLLVILMVAVTWNDITRFFIK